MFQSLTPVLVLIERFCALLPIQNQERMQDGLKLQIKCFAWGNIVHHILPKGFWVFLLNGNTRARCSYLISKYPSILQQSESFVLFSFFKKKKLFQRSIKYTPTLTTQLQPAETLHLPCGNRHHQTELMKNFLFLASHKQIQRCGPTIHTFTHLSILMYRDLSLKDSDSFLDFRLDLPLCV